MVSFKKTKAIFWVFLIAVNILSLFTIEGLLAILSFPKELPTQILHPPSYRKFIRNLEYSYFFKTNSLGLRYREFPREKPLNTTRIFVIGDSFVEGVGVDASETFSAKLELAFNGLRKHEFINLGLAGRGPYHYGRAFIRIAEKYNPDMVLLCIYANDLSDTSVRVSPDGFYVDPIKTRNGWRKFFHSLAPRAYIQFKIGLKTFYKKFVNPNLLDTAKHEAEKRGIPQDAVSKWERKIPAHLLKAADQGRFNGAYLTYGLLRPNFWTDSLDVDTDNAKHKLRVFSSLLQEILSFSSQNGISVRLIFIPSRLQYEQDFYSKKKKIQNFYSGVHLGVKLRKEWLTRETELQIFLRNFAWKNEIPFLDLTDTFRDAFLSVKNINYDLDEHWTPKGHTIAANAIFQWLISKKLLPMQ